MVDRTDLSLILPCYNEEAIFESSIETLLKLLNQTKYNFEIILIDDLSTDQTVQLIKNIAKKSERIRCIFHSKNTGRGGVVMEGIQMARGRIVGYLDIDLEVPPENILSHTLAIDQGYDVAYADRITKFEWRTIHRHFMHSVYIYLQRVLLQMPFNDTNAGCKFFNRENILPVLRECKETHWFWDTEILALAYLHKLKMKSLPAVYIPNPGKKSTVKKFKDSIYFIRKIVQFRKIVKELRNKIQ